MRTIIISATASFVILLPAGCAVLDLTKDHRGPPPVCEIHDIEMHPENIKVGGERVYVLDYANYAQAHFPNHGGHLLNFEKKDTPWNRDVIDFVCPECDEKYKKYWNDKRP